VRFCKILPFLSSLPPFVSNGLKGLLVHEFLYFNARALRQAFVQAHASCTAQHDEQCFHADAQYCAWCHTHRLPFSRCGKHSVRVHAAPARFFSFFLPRGSGRRLLHRQWQRKGVPAPPRCFVTREYQQARRPVSRVCLCVYIYIYIYICVCFG
jgi:hypothetical protein